MTYIRPFDQGHGTIAAITRRQTAQEWLTEKSPSRCIASSKHDLSEQITEAEFDQRRQHHEYYIDED